MVSNNQTLTPSVPARPIAAFATLDRPKNLTAPHPASNPCLGTLHDESLLMVSCFMQTRLPAPIETTSLKTLGVNPVMPHCCSNSLRSAPIRCRTHLTDSPCIRATSRSE